MPTSGSSGCATANVAAAVDFITIHILPYWEDFPVAAGQAAAHVDAIRRKVAAAFPGKEMLIGEVGWPSAGRMREGALPSPANQARVIQDVLALAERENFHVNVIEAYRPALEAGAGRHGRRPLGALSTMPRAHSNSSGARRCPTIRYWRWQAAGGVVFAVLIFAAAFAARRKARRRRRCGWRWPRTRSAGGILIGWTVENVPLESLGVGGWLRSLALARGRVREPAGA